MKQKKLFVILCVLLSLTFSCNDSSGNFDIPVSIGESISKSVNDKRIIHDHDNLYTLVEHNLCDINFDVASVYSHEGIIQFVIFSNHTVGNSENEEINNQYKILKSALTNKFGKVAEESFSTRDVCEWTEGRIKYVLENKRDVMMDDVMIHYVTLKINDVDYIED